MSLILDALNRSEAERRGGGEVPGLATEHFSGSEGDKFKLRVYLPWLALAVAVAVIAWLVLDRTGGEPGAVTPTVPVTATDEATSPRRPVPVARPPESSGSNAPWRLCRKKPSQRRQVYPLVIVRHRLLPP